MVSVSRAGDVSGVLDSSVLLADVPTAFGSVLAGCTFVPFGL